jgi:hypothetical protein
MVIGTKNEDAISQSFASLDVVHEVFDCGLFEAKDDPWLAVSPDGFATFDLPGVVKEKNIIDTSGRWK